MRPGKMLIDANIFLEILLDQEKSENCNTEFIPSAGGVAVKTAGKSI